MTRTNIHICGAGGIGTSGLALLYRELGLRVTATDARESEITQLLRKSGIEVDTKPRAEWASEAELLVVPSIFPQDHPEVKAARDHHVPVLSRTEALLRLCAESHCDPVICTGTLSRALCAALIAGSLKDCGYCLGLSENSAPHARFARQMVIDLDERELAAHAALLSPFESLSVLVSDWAQDPLGYYDESFDLKCFIDAVSPHAKTLVFPDGDGFSMRRDATTTHVALNVSMQKTENAISVGGIRFSQPPMTLSDASAAAAAALFIDGPVHAANPTGWFQVMDERRTFDIRMHPVSVRNAVQSLKTRFVGEPVTVVIKPYASTLNAYDVNTWRKAFSGALAVYVMTPGYNATDKDCRKLSTALKMRGLCSATYPKKQMLDECHAFVGHQLWLGAPDMFKP